MASITAGGKRIHASPVDSLLVNLMKFGIPIQHKCGGRAMCGTCRVKILSGAEKLSPIRTSERTRLEAASIPEGYRLACQTYTFGDVEIEIPPLDEPLPKSSAEKSI